MDSLIAVPNRSANHSTTDFDEGISTLGKLEIAEANEEFRAFRYSPSPPARLPRKYLARARQKSSGSLCTRSEMSLNPLVTIMSHDDEHDDDGQRLLNPLAYHHIDHCATTIYIMWVQSLSVSDFMRPVVVSPTYTPNESSSRSRT